MFISNGKVGFNSPKILKWLINENIRIYEHMNTSKSHKNKPLLSEGASNRQATISNCISYRMTNFPKQRSTVNQNYN